jgi:hypothetical protein
MRGTDCGGGVKQSDPARRPSRTAGGRCRMRHERPGTTILPKRLPIRDGMVRSGRFAVGDERKETAKLARGSVDKSGVDADTRAAGKNAATRKPGGLGDVLLRAAGDVVDATADDLPGRVLRDL